MANRFLKIHPLDNVFVALTDLKQGEEVVHKQLTIKLQDDVQAKHKFATKAFMPDDEIFMYGIVVGKATQAIAEGGVIGTHNVKHKASPFSGKKIVLLTPPMWRSSKTKPLWATTGLSQVGNANYGCWFHWFLWKPNVNVIRQHLRMRLGSASLTRIRSTSITLCRSIKKERLTPFQLNC